MLNANNPQKGFGSDHFQARGRQQDTVTDAYRRGIPPPFSFVNLEYNTGSKITYININKMQESTVNDI